MNIDMTVVESFEDGQKYRIEGTSTFPAELLTQLLTYNEPIIVKFDSSSSFILKFENIEGENFFTARMQQL